MTTENIVLMRNSRESLTGKWGLAICGMVLYALVIIAIQVASRFFPFAGIISLFISGPFAVGIARFSLSLSRKEDANVEQIFSGFNNYVTNLVAYLLLVVFIILWLLLLIVPGIIASLSYALTFYILADDNSIKPMDALNRSKKMMDGHKMKLFRLGLRLFGLALLCILTLGIAYLWFMPYASVVMANFYDDVKNQNLNTENAENPILA